MLKKWVRTGLFCLGLLYFSLSGMAGSGLEKAEARTMASSEIWPEKAWTVRFSQELNPDSITPETVYVLDSQGQRITQVSLQVSKDIVSVGLAEGYSYPQGDYRLVVAPGIESTTGKDTTEEVIKPFTILKPTYFTFRNDVLPTGLAGKGYSIYLEGNRSTGTSWAINQGSLPAGLTLDPGSGEIKGKPEAAGSFSFSIKKTSAKGSEEKALSLDILPGNFTLSPLISPSISQGQQPETGSAQLRYPNGSKKAIDIYWEPVNSQQGGNITLRGQLGGSDYQVEIPGIISYLQHVDYKYYYWATINWRTVTVDLDGKVRDAYMDASYPDRSKIRKMDFMKELSEQRGCNVFGVNTNALDTGSTVTFRFYDAFGNLLEKRDMLVD